MADMLALGQVNRKLGLVERPPCTKSKQLCVFFRNWKILSSWNIRMKKTISWEIEALRQTSFAEMMGCTVNSAYRIQFDLAILLGRWFSLADIGHWVTKSNRNQPFHAILLDLSDDSTYAEFLVHYIRALRLRSLLSIYHHIADGRVTGAHDDGKFGNICTRHDRHHLAVIA